MAGFAVFLAFCALGLVTMVIFWNFLNSARIRKLKDEIKALDPENVSQQLRQATEKIDEWQKKS